RADISKFEIEKAKEEHDKRIADARKAAEETVRAKQEEVQGVLNAIKEQATEQLKNEKLTAFGRNKIIDEANKEYEKVQRDLADDIIQSNIDALQKIIDTEQLTAEERAAIEVELFKLKTDLTNTLYDQIAEK